MAWGLVFGTGSGLFGYVGMLVVGLPALLLVRHLRVGRSLVLCALGLFAGLISAIALGFEKLLVPFGLCGGAIGLAGWFVAYWNSNDSTEARSNETAV